MKSSGAGLIWLSLTMIGFYAAVRLKKRTAFFSCVLSFLRALSIEMEYSVSDLPSIVVKISDSQLCSNLRFLKECVVLMEMGYDFPVAWKNAVNRYTQYINDEEKDELLNIGASLGTTDLSGQKKLLELFSGHINSFYLSAGAQQEKYYRICILSGTLIGFGVFILLI